MGRGRVWGLVLFMGCAGIERAPAPLGGGEGHRFVDRDHGFEILRPGGEEWAFTSGRGAPEGILIPVTVVHQDTGAQVVVQIAPNVAPAWEFAERLAAGLNQRHGFRTTEPLRAGWSAAEFTFTVEDEVFGRVGVRSEEDRTFVLLGTWPASAPGHVVHDVAAIMASLRSVPGVKRTVYARACEESGPGEPGPLQALNLRSLPGEEPRVPSPGAAGWSEPGRALSLLPFDSLCGGGGI